MVMVCWMRVRRWCMLILFFPLAMDGLLIVATTAVNGGGRDTKAVASEEEEEE